MTDLPPVSGSNDYVAATVDQLELVPVPRCNTCGPLQHTIDKWHRETHKCGCPHRTDPYCQAHPAGCDEFTDIRNKKPSYQITELRGNAISRRPYRRWASILTFRKWGVSDIGTDSQGRVRAMRPKWKLEVIRSGSAYRWRLVNRDGDLVMTSRDWYPTRVGARRAAEYEVTQLRDTHLAA